MQAAVQDLDAAAKGCVAAQQHSEGLVLWTVRRQQALLLEDALHGGLSESDGFLQEDNVCIVGCHKSAYDVRLR